MIRAVVIIFILGVGLSASHKPYLPSDHSGAGRIINGMNASQGQFPYIAYMYNSVGLGELSCSASILTENWLLTAAHCCVIGTTPYIYTSSVTLSSGGIYFDIAEKRAHPGYVPDRYYHNDLCLVRINGSIPLGPDAQQVTLPAEDLVVPDNSSVVVAGWGTSTGGYPDNLRYATDYYARSPENCEAASDIPDFPGQICAVGSGGDQGICVGDFGGPLIFNGVQVGVASFVFLPCANLGSRPDYYTRVSRYIPWIQENLGQDAHSLKFAIDEELSTV